MPHPVPALLANLLAPALLAPALLAPALLANVLQANLLLPVLQLLRPQLEQRIKSVCVETAAAGNGNLAAQLEEPCAQLARPTSKCLVEETAASPPQPGGAGRDGSR